MKLQVFDLIGISTVVVGRARVSVSRVQFEYSWWEQVRDVRLHVVSDVDGIQEVAQEAVTQMHALLLAAAVDGHDAWIHDDHDSDDEVVFLEHGVGDERNEVERFVLAAVQFDDHDQQVGPGEASAARLKSTGQYRNWLSE